MAIFILTYKQPQMGLILFLKINISNVWSIIPKMKLQNGMELVVLGLLELLSRELWQVEQHGWQECFTRRLLNGPGNAATDK